MYERVRAGLRGGVQVVAAAAGAYSASSQPLLRDLQAMAVSLVRAKHPHTHIHRAVSCLHVARVNILARVVHPLHNCGPAPHGAATASERVYETF